MSRSLSPWPSRNPLSHPAGHYPAGSWGGPVALSPLPRAGPPPTNQQVHTQAGTPASNRKAGPGFTNYKEYDMRKPTGRTITGILAALAIGAGGAMAVTAEPLGQPIHGGINEWHTHAVPGSDVLVSGCVIRFDSADQKPRLHVNAAHRCSGVESVDVDGAGNLRVHQTVQGAACHPILFAQIQTDETVGGKHGIVGGASGGTSVTRYWLFSTKLDRRLSFHNAADRALLFDENGQANVWVGWFHTTNPGC